MYRVIIADDHAIVRQGLKMIIDDYPEFKIVEEAESGDELLEKLPLGKYDIIILDVSMPGREIFDILQQIKAINKDIPILIFTMSPEKLYAKRLFKSGVSGYICKDSKPEEIIAALRKVAIGGIYITHSLAEELAEDLLKRTARPLYENLTSREFQVLSLIAAAKSLEEIAQILYLSKTTVSNHRYTLMKKLRLKNNSEITQYAIKNKLI